MSTLVEDAARLREIEAEVGDLESTLKDLKAKAVQAEQDLFERMEQEHVESIKTNGVLYVPVETNYGQVQDRAAFVEWAEDEMPELLERKERKKLVNELIRERLDAGDEIPPGLGFYTKEYVSQRGSS